MPTEWRKDLNRRVDEYLDAVIAGEPRSMELLDLLFLDYGDAVVHSACRTAAANRQKRVTS